MKKILLILLVGLFQNFIFGATITSTATGGNWNSGSSWVGGVVPGAADDVVIVNGATVTVVANSFVNNVTVQSGGTLTIPNNIVFTVYGNVNVNSGGQFNAGTGNSDSAIIKVYGNFTNQGTANFWKSIVVIKGNLSTTSTILQNNGNILVGGNVSGVIGGSGSGTVYPVNPNATVDVTGNAEEKPAGTQPTDPNLVALMNEVIYGGLCSPAISLNSVTATSSCAENKVSSVTVNSLPTILPIGNYTVIYSLGYNSNSTSYTASMSVTSAGVGNFLANLSIVNLTSSSTIRIDKIISSSCYSNITSNNVSNSSYMHAVLTAPNAANGSYQCDRKWLAQWQPDSTRDGYYLDVAIDPNFTNFFPGYENKYIAGGNTQSEVISNLEYGGIYYYRVRAKTYCGTSANSSTITININGNNSSTPGTIGGGASSICVGNTTTFTKDPNSWPSTGTWSIFNQTGSATITQGGVVTGVSPGTVLVVFTTQNGGCGTSSRRALTIDGATFTSTPSSPICSNIDATYTTQGGKTNYVWTISGVLGTDYTITTGSTSSTSNSVTLKWLTTGSKTVTVNYSGSCSGPAASNTITVNSVPVAAGAITGAANVCQGQTNVSYSIPAITNATSYLWSYSGAGATITGTTNTPTITFASNATSGNLTVRGVNSCGNGTVSANYAITVSNSAPATPGTITQPTNKCAGSTGNTFSITAVTGATSYTWSVTGTGWSVIGGQGTVSATITIGSGTGTVSVTSTNACGTSSASTTGNITPNSLSVVPTGITGTTTICNGSSTTLTVNGGTVGTGATVQWFTGSCGGTSAGTGNSITVSPTSNTTYYVRYSGTCNTTACVSQLVTVNPLPGTPTVTAATNVTCSSFLANWTAATNATGYYLDVSTVNDFSTGPYSNLDIGLVSSYNVTGLDKKTTYFYRLRAYNSCSTSVNSNYVQIKTLDVPTITAPVASSVCSGNTYSSGAITSTGTVFDWSRAAVANINGGVAGTGGTGIANATGFTEVLTNYTANPINVTYVLTPRVTSSGCTGSPYNLIVTVNPTPTVPTVGTITNISCTTNTGSVALSGLPSGNWTITTTPATVSTPGSGGSTTITGLAAGSYTFMVTNASGCPSPATGTVTISDNSSTTWNGTLWSNGLPDASKNVIIASVPSYTFAAGFTACALTINSGVVATVPSGVTLTVTNVVTTNGQLIFENNASLVQINDVQNSGAITYKRISQPMKNFDFTYWSSPVAGQTLFNLSPNTLYDKYLSYSGTGWKVETSSNVMKPAIGYIIRTPKGGTWPAPYAETVVFPYSQPVQFIGVPNNGYIQSSQTMVAGNYYLAGNPYPCAIDAEAFLYDNLNNTDVLDGTIYFWTHNTPVNPSLAQYKYYSADYATFNKSGGTATWYSPGNNAAPDGYIAAGQSFFTLASKPGRVEFNNSMRVTGNNSTFFKPGKTSKSAKLEKHRLWLNLINSGGAFKQTLIGYIEGATNTYDKNFDGLSFDGNSYIDFYSVNATDNLTIQGRALPFNDADVVPLGYRSTIAGDFTIAIDHADGNLATQRVYLEDKQTGTFTELTAGNYTFNTKAGTFNSRFVLRYANKTTLGTGDFETAKDAISILVQDKTITIDSTVENIDKVFIYDIAGKQLYTKEKVNNLQLAMQNLPFAQQVLLVKIFLENGTVTTKKVVFK